MIEKLLQELTAALIANTAALQAVADNQGKTAAKVSTPLTGTAAVGSKSETVAAIQVRAEQIKAFSYDDVKAAGTALAKAKPGAALREVLAEFGVDHANKLRPEQYADFIAKANERAKAK